MITSKLLPLQAILVALIGFPVTTLGGAAGSVLAGATYEECKAKNGAEKIYRPIYPDQAVSGQFRYSYRYLRGTDPQAPVVINLPGGPGQSSINMGDPRHTDSYGFIQTDPRGIGCNRHGDSIPDDAINTDTLASDIVAIIRHLKLTNYIIYGVSYGTVLATKVAFEIEQLGLTPPTSIVLEGVIGKANKKTQVEQSYSKQWNAVKAQLGADVLAELSASPLPFGIDPRQWALFIKGRLVFGKLPNIDFSLVNQLKLLAGSPAKRLQLQQSVESVGGPGVDEYRVYNLIACRELYDEDYWTILSGGVLTADIRSGDDCKSIPFAHPIDTSNWRIHTKIYYFAGGKDPATPMAGARYHFQNQSLASKRIFVSVPEAGHSSLKVNLSDCKDSLWDLILSNEDDLRPALNNCSLDTSVQVK